MAQVDQITVLIKGDDQLSRPAIAATKSLQQMDKAADGAGGALTRAASGAGRFAASLAKFGALGVGLGAVQAGISAISSATGGLGKALIGTNITMENTRAQLVAMTKDGKQADKILEQIREEADKTPFAFEEMAKATASLMPAAKQSGAALMDLVKQAEILAASNPEQGLEGAAFALREALSGDFTSVIERFDLPRQRINELVKQGVPALRAISTAMKEMGLDATLVAARAETLEGRWSTFLDTISGVTRIIGQPIFDRLKQGLMTVQNLLDANKPLITAWATAVGGALGRAADAVVAGGGKLLATMRNLWTGAQSPAELLAQAIAAGRSIAGDLTAWLGKQWAAIDWSQVWKQATGLASGLQTNLGNIASTVTTWVGTQWARIDWGAVWAQAQGIGQGLVAAAPSIVASVTDWLTAQWAAVKWATIWASVTDHAAALEANLAPVTAQLQAWLMASAAAVDWNRVWADAKTSTMTVGAFETLVQHTETNTAAAAVGRWLGVATSDGVDFLVAYLTAPQGENAQKVGAGLVALFTNANRNAGPGIRLGMRVFGIDTANVLIEEYVRALRTPAAVQRIVDAIVGVYRDALDHARAIVANFRGPPIPGLSSGTTAPADVKPGAPREGPTGPIGAYQHGGSFYVGGSGGPDSQMVAFRASPGERVDITPPGGRGGGGPVHVVVHVGEVRDRGDADYLADVLPDALARALETARTQQGQPYAGGLVRFA